MTPVDSNPEPTDEHLLDRAIACDALLHAIPREAGPTSEWPPKTDADVDERGRSRLLLLLRMLDASEGSTGGASDEGESRRSDLLGEGRLLLDRFEVVEDLGAGGFGFVVRARDRLLGREVALKMPLPERMLGSDMVARSLREARAAARLDHPNIVRVHDAGELGPVGYFIASEFCEGPNLRRWLRARNEPVPPRLAAGWAAALADAVQHAHDRGILHRDIKPDNVILAPASTPGEFIPRLTDFGLAKVVEEPGEETRSGARMGTPHYMAPEQAAGHHREVGPATDVYALGATLYETMTGRPPFRGEDEIQTMRLVLESEPIAPRSLRPGLPRDLETICLKCLRKEPARRYDSAAGLRDDLRRFLEGRPIRARRTSAAERAWRWCRRNKAVAGLLATVILLLAAVAGVASVGYVREAAALAAAREAEGLAKDEAGKARAAEGLAKDEAGKARAAEQEMRREWYAASVNLMQPAWDAGQVGRVRDLLSATEDYPDRGFEWSYWQRLCHLERFTLSGHRAGVKSVAWSPDGSRIATGGWDMTARVWDAADGRQLLALEGHTSGIYSVAWSPDSLRLATGSGDGTARIWPAEVGREPLKLEGHDAPILCVAWSADGKRLATASQDGTARVWDTADGRPLFSIKGHDGLIMAVAWSPDGRRLATGGRDRIARVWDAANGGPLLALAGHAGSVWSVSWSPDGKRLATGSDDATVRTWDAADGAPLLTLDGHTSRVLTVAWSPDGSRLATESGDGTALICDAASGRRLRALRGHVFGVSALAWSPDGTRLATASEDGTAKVWDAAEGPEARTLEGDPDGVRSESGSWHGPGNIDGKMKTEGADSGRRQVTNPGPASRVMSVAWSPDGSRLASGSGDGTATVWDGSTGRQRLILRGPAAPVLAVAWSPDGRRLVTASQRGTPRIWDASDGREILALQMQAGEVRSVAWSPDGSRIATGEGDRKARIWDAATGRERLVLEGMTEAVFSVAWSPDGTRLATGSRDRTARIRDAAAGRAILVPLRHAGLVWSVAWSPDGSRLATASGDRAVRVWDASTGRELIRLVGHAGPVTSVAWSPDGSRLATGSRDMTAKVWNATDGRELLTLKGHAARVTAVSWSRDGLRLATGGFDGKTRIWEAADAESAVRWAGQDRAVTDLLARGTFRGPRAQGFLRDWLLLLPLPLGSGELGAQGLGRSQLPGEAGLRPRAGERVPMDGGDLVWREYRSPDAVLDFNEALGRATEMSVAYAVCYLESDRPRHDLWLQIGSDDQSKAYLNGREIYRNRVPRTLEALDRAGPVTLERGTNVLVLKVVNAGWSWEVCARLVDAEGQPAEDIRVRTMP